LEQEKSFLFFFFNLEHELFAMALFGVLVSWIGKRGEGFVIIFSIKYGETLWLKTGSQAHSGFWVLGVTVGVEVDGF